MYPNEQLQEARQRVFNRPLYYIFKGLSMYNKYKDFLVQIYLFAKVCKYPSSTSSFANPAWLALTSYSQSQQFIFSRVYLDVWTKVLPNSYKLELQRAKNPKFVHPSHCLDVWSKIQTKYDPLGLES